MSDERRRHHRYEIALAAELRLGDTTFTATTRDVSDGGCCIACAYVVPEKQIIDCALFVVVDGIEEAGLPPLRVKASVQWMAESDDGDPAVRYIAGLQFQEIAVEQKRWLAQAIARSRS